MLDSQTVNAYLVSNVVPDFRNGRGSDFDTQCTTELKFLGGEICSNLSNHFEQRMIA